MESYYRELKKIGSSTPEETLRLFKEYKAGNLASRDKLVTFYLKFALKVSRKYLNMGVLAEDLVQEANMGLLIAIDRWDPDKGEFSSYAFNHIRNNIITNCFGNKGAVTSPRGTPHVDNRFYYREILENDCVSEENDHVDIRKYLRLVDGRNLEIVKAFFGIGRTQLDREDLAEEFGLTRVRINQIIKRFLDDCRENS